nr:MAG TPA: hypothetical protein [Caudoviricetes sp.]
MLKFQIISSYFQKMSFDTPSLFYCLFHCHRLGLP